MAHFESMFSNEHAHQTKFTAKEEQAEQAEYKVEDAKAAQSKYNEELIINCYRESQEKGRHTKHVFPACLITANQDPLGPAWLDDQPVKEDVAVLVFGRTRYGQLALLLRQDSSGEVGQFERCGIAEILDMAKMKSFTDGFELKEVTIV